MPKGRRNNGEGTLRQRNDGRWDGRVVIGYDENGRAKTNNVLAKTKTGCAEKLTKLKEECGRTTDRLKPEMPFGDWLDYWYQNYSKPTLRETTQSTYENRIYHHIIPSIGKIPLNKLTTNDIQQFYAKLKRGGRLRYTDVKGEGLSDRMVRACHASCRTALEKAVTEGLLRINPAIGCKLPPKKAREMQVLTQPEILRFLAQAKEEGYSELFLLERTPGMRRGEILGLRWSDLNLKTGELHIQRQVVLTGKQNIISQPKTKASIRTLVLPPDMVEILAELKKTTESEWIFPSPLDLAKPRNPSAIYNRFQLILERAQCRKVRFHDLRHPYVKHATKKYSVKAEISDHQITDELRFLLFV